MMCTEQQQQQQTQQPLWTHQAAPHAQQTAAAAGTSCLTRQPAQRTELDSSWIAALAQEWATLHGYLYALCWEG